MHKTLYNISTEGQVPLPPCPFLRAPMQIVVNFAAISDTGLHRAYMASSLTTAVTC